MNRFLAGAAVLLSCLSAPAVAGAATFTVDSTADTGVGVPCADPAHCSLRGAVTAANAAGGADTVSITPGDYHLANGQLEVTDSLFLSGSGGPGAVTIDADGLSRVLRITAPTTISDLTITGGYATDAPGDPFRAQGAGIHATAALALDGVTIAGNRAEKGAGGFEAQGGGVWIDEQLSPNDTTFEDNEAVATGGARASGGGLYLGPNGASNLLGLRLERNRAQVEASVASGGGLFSEATGTTRLTGAFVENVAIATLPGGTTFAVGGGAYLLSGARYDIAGSTFTDNAAAVDGGHGQGGGLLAAAPVVTVADSTFDGNDVMATGAGATGAGGGLSVAGDVAITNTTIVGNGVSGTGGRGGGVFVGAQYALSTLTATGLTVTRNAAETGGGLALFRTDATTTGSILAANTASTGADCSVLAAASTSTLTSAGGNVLGSATPCGTTATGTDVVSATPGVGPIADHGGLTPTALLTAGSPALDRYTTGCPAFDQRFVARPQGSACDAGAVEMRAASFSAAPAALAFGSIEVGSASATQDVTLTNEGDLDGTPALSFGGTNPGAFSASGCAAPVARGAACTLAVRFAPGTPGPKTASLDGATPSVALSGTATAAPPPPGGGTVPQCRDLAASTPFETVVGIQLECSATVWDWEIVSAPEHGTLGPIGPDGAIGYTPDTGFSGRDAFRYVAEGAGGQSAPATVVVDVGPGPARDAPSGTGRTCTPYRVTLRLNPRGVRLVRARVKVDGVGVQPVRDGRRWTASFEVKGAPGQQVTVRITGRRANGERLRRTRVLTVC